MKYVIEPFNSDWQGPDGITLYEHLSNLGAVTVEDDTVIALRWGVDDVMEVRKDLDVKQAVAVLAEVKRTHDASVGVCWDTLRIVADMLFPNLEYSDDDYELNATGFWIHECDEEEDD